MKKIFPLIVIAFLTPLCGCIVTPKSLGAIDTGVWKRVERATEEIQSANAKRDPIALIKAAKDMIKVIEEFASSKTSYVGVNRGLDGYRLVAGYTSVGHETGFGLNLIEDLGTVPMVVSSSPAIRKRVLVTDLDEGTWKKLPEYSRFYGMFRSPSGFKKLLRPTQVSYTGTPGKDSCEHLREVLVRSSKAIAALSDDEVLALPPGLACPGLEVEMVSLDFVEMEGESFYTLRGIVHSDRTVELVVSADELGDSFVAMLANDPMVFQSISNLGTCTASGCSRAPRPSDFSGS